MMAIIHGMIAIVRTAAIMIYKTNSKIFSVKGRGEYLSKSDFIILADKRGMSRMELAEELKVNYKTACLPNTKRRILMQFSNEGHCLDSAFYESDVAYAGARSSNGKRGMGTDKRPFLAVLATVADGQYPTRVRMREIGSDRSELIKNFFDEYVVTGGRRLLNTDGKTTHNVLKGDMKARNEPIDYENESRRLCFLDKIVSNFNACMLHVCHGIGKRMLPLYFSEFEWRHNHRNAKDYLARIKGYVALSEAQTKKMNH